MSYVKAICSRCTRLAYCYCMANLKYCEPCFEAVNNDPSQKAIMDKLYKTLGIEDIQNG